MAILIRQADSGEAQYVAAVGRAAFSAAFGADNTPEDMAAYLAAAFSPEKIAAQLADPRSTFFLAEDHHPQEVRPVGYARLLVTEAPTCMTGLRAIELERFYLLPEWIGTGVAAPLMQAVIDSARGGGWEAIWLGVWQQNPRAIRFYQKWGFTIVGEQLFQLGAQAQHDWIMSLDLRQGSGA